MKLSLPIFICSTLKTNLLTNREEMLQITDQLQEYLSKCATNIDNLSAGRGFKTSPSVPLNNIVFNNFFFLAPIPTSEELLFLRQSQNLRSG